MMPTIQLGPLRLASYTVLLDLSVLAAFAALYFQARASGQEPRSWLDAGLAGLVGGIVAGRIAFVLANLDYFGGHVAEIVRVWQGGLNWTTAVAGAVLVLGLWCRRRRLPLARMLDTLAPAFVAAAVLASSGCLLSGCGYGREVFAPTGIQAWFAPELPDAYGVIAPRLITQVFGIALAGLCGPVVLALSGRLPPGGRFAMVLLLYSAASIALDATRGDAVPMLGPLRYDQALDLGLALACAAWLMWARRTNSPG